MRNFALGAAVGAILVALSPEPQAQDAALLPPIFQQGRFVSGPVSGDLEILEVRGEWIRYQAVERGGFLAKRIGPTGSAATRWMHVPTKTDWLDVTDLQKKK